MLCPLDHRKLWIDPDGIAIPVPESQSHEEWANEMGLELEDLLDQGWVRIQNLPAYIYLDFRFRLNALQAVTVGRLVGGAVWRVVVESGGEVRRFGDRERPDPA